MWRNNFVMLNDEKRSSLVAVGAMPKQESPIYRKVIRSVNKKIHRLNYDFVLAANYIPIVSYLALETAAFISRNRNFRSTKSEDMVRLKRHIRIVKAKAGRESQVNLKNKKTWKESSLYKILTGDTETKLSCWPGRSFY
ncbi:hypothetical protein [Flavobacterium sp. 3HN19-14]|uniref:hypothetical protein n=1 Tax=Flavobacterium sp. 3HN19-14 TaxID=3448133 RepID=UPI003EE0A27D